MTPCLKQLMHIYHIQKLSLVHHKKWPLDCLKEDMWLTNVTPDNASDWKACSSACRKADPAATRDKRYQSNDDNLYTNPIPPFLSNHCNISRKNKITPDDQERHVADDLHQCGWRSDVEHDGGTQTNVIKHLSTIKHTWQAAEAQRLQSRQLWQSTVLSSKR